MKKITIVFFLSLVFMGNMVRAQVPMAIPNGSFEQWSTHPGYSISDFIIPISVYESYSTPSIWNYPTYPVNETANLMGMNVTINTAIPVIKAIQETGVVPDSTYAVKLQTFMLSEIVSSTVLSLASGYIDPSLTQEALPSILTTGEINIEAFIPLLLNLMSDTVDLNAMVPILLNEDIDDYITGGLAMGNFRPGRLTGSYKYHSATSGDNGGVMLLGLRHNNTTNRRDIVGAGMNVDLTDVSNYTTFNVEYQHLSDLIPGMPNLEPDTLIVFIFSSASSNRQQGSYLCLDNLMLIPAPDTCSDVTSLTATPYIHEAQLTWNINSAVDNFEIEYGYAGFLPGSGTTMIATSTALTLNGLEANTAYEVLVRTVCSDTIYGEWASVQFNTLQDTCATVLNLGITSWSYDAFPQSVLEWNGSSQPDHWEVEYGPQGFQQGNGTIVEVDETHFDIFTLEETGVLLPNTWYDFYVRSVCSNGVNGDWGMTQYRTYCAKVSEPMASGNDSWVNDANLIEGYRITWTDNYNSRLWGVYYGIFNPTMPDSWGVYEEVETPMFEFPPLRPGVTYTAEIHSLCDENNYSDVVIVNFTTPEVSIPTSPNSIATTYSLYPNPANSTVTIETNHTAEMTLTDVTGREFGLWKVDDGTTTIDISNLPQGIYFVNIDGTVKKLIIK